MKKILLLIFSLVFPYTLFSQEDCSEIFFSEYVEGSGNNKALEIYNPTNSIVDLSYYWVARYSNGSASYTGGGITQLAGFLPAHSVFIFVNGQTTDNDLVGGNISPKVNPDLQALANQLDHDYPAPTYMNGNDAIALLKSDNNTTLANAVSVDLIGEIGLGAAISSETGWSYVKDSTLTYRYDSVNTTQGQVINYIVQSKDINGANFGPYWMAWTKDHTLIRKPSVKHGVTQNPSPFVVTMEWDTLSNEKDVWDSLGTHNCDCNTYTAVNNPMEDLGQIAVYPNPVIHNTFQISSNREIQSFELLNMIGQAIYKKELTGHFSIYTVQPGTLRKGMYLLRVRFKDQTTAVKKIWLQ